MSKKNKNAKEVYSLRDYWRKWFNIFMMLGLCALSIFAVLPLVFIVYYILNQGLSAVDLDFFTKLPTSPGEGGGGMANALVGSAIVVGLAGLIGIPWGIGMGIYLNEYKNNKTAEILRVVVDLLISVPSIVVGIFIYGVLVIRYGFSSYAGAGALLLILLPIIVKGTEEILRMIPSHIREAGLALGLPRWKVITSILVPGCFSMLITIVMLAIARISGETAPLLFTALGNQFHIKSLSEPVATLPVQIYEFSKSGFEELENKAWVGSMILIFFVFLVNFITRFVLFLCKRPAIKLSR